MKYNLIWEATLFKKAIQFYAKVLYMEFFKIFLLFNQVFELFPRLFWHYSTILLRKAY